MGFAAGLLLVEGGLLILLALMSLSVFGRERGPDPKDPALTGRERYFAGYQRTAQVLVKPFLWLGATSMAAGAILLVVRWLG